MSNIEISQAERLDMYVLRQMPLLTRSFASKLIERGKVTVNGEPETKSGYKLRFGDDVVIDFDTSTDGVLPEITLPILYEDADCVVIEKPYGLLTHSKGAFNPEATVASWLRSKLQAELAAVDEEEPNNRAGIVHRLDRATSGVMICAKTNEALSWLQKQFSQRKVKKTYIAVIAGHLQHPEAVIDLPIERNPKKPQTFRVGANGKPATTAYKVLASNDEYSLVELKPHTGRTHQLRVHLEYLGHPIVGDVFYGGKPADRLYLHAHELELTLPNRERQVFTSVVPPEFEARVRNA